MSARTKGFFAEDQGSTNGTFVDGLQVTSRRPLANGAVIRVGRAVLVFHESGEEILEPGTTQTPGIVGRFHAAALVRELKEAALFSRRLLLATKPCAWASTATGGSCGDELLSFGD